MGNLKFGNETPLALYMGVSGSTKAYYGTEVVFEGGSPVDYSSLYTTFEILTGGTINFTNNLGSKTISYSTNNGSSWTSVSAGDSISVSAGDKVLFKGTNGSYGDKVIDSSDVYFNAYGNMMSLIYGDNFTGKTTFTEESVFQSFFQDSHLVDASHLILPATLITRYCYFRMFQGCTSLISAPNILPATTIAPFCYSYIFHTCSSLVRAPELPASVLADFCYFQAFYYCSSLNCIKCLATDLSSTLPTGEWTSYVSGTGTFVKNPNMSSWPSGNDGIPNGWTVQDA